MLVSYNSHYIKHDSNGKIELVPLFYSSTIDESGDVPCNQHYIYQQKSSQHAKYTNSMANCQIYPILLTICFVIQTPIGDAPTLLSATTTCLTRLGPSKIGSSVKSNRTLLVFLDQQKENDQRLNFNHWNESIYWLINYVQGSSLREHKTECATTDNFFFIGVGHHQSHLMNSPNRKRKIIKSKSYLKYYMKNNHVVVFLLNKYLWVFMQINLFNKKNVHCN